MPAMTPSSLASRSTWRSSFLVSIVASKTLPSTRDGVAGVLETGDASVGCPDDEALSSPNAMSGDSSLLEMWTS